MTETIERSEAPGTAGVRLLFSDAAREKVASVLATQDPPVRAIRVSSPFRGRYSMNLEPDGNPAPDDTVLALGAFEVYVDPASLPHVDGASVDWVEQFGGGGFKFTPPEIQTAPRPTAPEGSDGEIWRRIQQVLDEEVNPAVAAHGGVITLIDVRGSTVYVEMGGGCQGCAMSRMTLKQGVERLLKASVPEIEELLDVTDHAGGRNPYYAPA